MCLSGGSSAPLLFVLATDLSQFAVNDLLHKGLLSLLIPSRDPYFPIVHYVDDTLLMIPVVDSQLIPLRYIFMCFHASTRLKVNFNKYHMVPINGDHAKAARLANMFDCNMRSMPFTYLGLPMSTTRPKIQDLVSVVNGVECRSWTVHPLSLRVLASSCSSLLCHACQFTSYAAFSSLLVLLSNLRGLNDSAFGVHLIMFWNIHLLLGLWSISLKRMVVWGLPMYKFKTKLC